MSVWNDQKSDCLLFKHVFADGAQRAPTHWQKLMASFFAASFKGHGDWKSEWFCSSTFLLLFVNYSFATSIGNKIYIWISDTKKWEEVEKFKLHNQAWNAFIFHIWNWKLKRSYSIQILIIQIDTTSNCPSFQAILKGVFHYIKLKSKRIEEGTEMKWIRLIFCARSEGEKS